ncbi:hypothetical protein [Streptococcus thermophilus]|uniref:hypothetical protein n=1 Tax=Streptococcus thermophilus TaxID=1308 RepID=UPI00355BF451
MGLFFYNQKGSIISIEDLPTTEIIEPFLSDHTTSLGEEKHKVYFSDELTFLDKLTLISQIYDGQLKGQFDIKHDNQKVTYQGQVTEISKDEIVVKSDEQFHLIKVENILAIQLAEGGETNE